MTLSLREVEELGENLLEKTAHPIPRFRIFKDVLRLPRSSDRFSASQSRLRDSKWVEELRSTQLPDGTWGRFHSRDSALRRRFPTTELAIRRALALGLEADSDILYPAILFMEKFLSGQANWSDPPERHEGWPVNTHFITAGTLARINPGHALIPPYVQRWVDIVERTFRSGAYNPADEREAHRQLNGIQTKGKYLKLASLYPLLLLSSSSSQLSIKKEQELLSWVWNREGGIYYVCGLKLNQVPPLASKSFSSWLEALEVLSRFISWRAFARQAIEQVWYQMDLDGLWDFGPQARASIYFPLSESWRNLLDRKVDCTVRILALLRTYCEG